MEKAPNLQKSGNVGILISLLCILAIAALEAFALTYWTRGLWHESLELVLQIMAIYGIGFGFISNSDILRNFGALVEEMASPNPAKFLRSNFSALGILFSTASIGLDPKRLPDTSIALGCIGQMLLLLLLPIMIIYSILHIFLILPIAYLGYLFASALVTSILGAGSDERWTVTQDKDISHINVKAIVNSNPVAVKSFLIGIPAAILSIGIKVVELFFY